MLHASLFPGLLLCCFVCPAHGTKGSDNAQASVHALYMVYTVPLLLSFAVCAAERGCRQPAKAESRCQLVHCLLFIAVVVTTFCPKYCSLEMLV